MLIPVTSFFRDAAVFENLCESVFPAIIKTKKENETIRVWAAGCSTGQEAYSLAICLKEFLGNGNLRAQIFATDLSEQAIAKARTGRYTKSELVGVSQHRLNEFFTKTDGGFCINKEVRDMCVFASHNFLKDPPFGKIDFVSCRNVLIYMEPYLQKKALATFHYALNPKGFLLLGKSETAGSVPLLFAVADKRDKLFSRKDGAGRYMHVATQSVEQNMYDSDTNTKGNTIQTDFQRTAEDIILNKYAPAGVVVNESMDIVYFRGATDDYLAQAQGKPTHNVLKMAKAGLAFDIRRVLQKSKKEKTTVIKDNISAQVNGSERIITIEAVPLPNPTDIHYLLLFYETPVSRLPSLAAAASGQDAKRVLQYQHLENELIQNREDMRSITEDQDAANEELQSANEELLSGSEELQSLNEELEASKEEMQSTNEELTVLNHELSSLNEQLNGAYAQQLLLQKKLEAQALMTENLLMTAPGFICTMKGPEHIFEMVNARYQQLFGSGYCRINP